MSGRTFYKPRDAASPKEAQASLVAACGGLKGAAASTRIGKTVLAQCTDGDHPTRHMPVDVVLDLERKAGAPFVTRYLAAESGHLLVPVRSESRDPYPLVLGRITKELGELLSAGGEALRESRMNVAGARTIKREALDVASALAELLADCDATIARGEP